MTQKPIIHFAHANGIPSASYGYLFEQLNDDFDIVSIPALGTHPDYPVDEGWQSLTRQVIDSVKQTLATATTVPKPAKVIGLGHSLGAVCTLQAAYQAPELFSQVILLDPPLLVGRYAMLVHWAKRFSPHLLDKLTPAGLSSRRRDTWQSRTVAYEHLQAKGFYQQFDARCFADFIQYGLSDTAEGTVTLTVPKTVEVAVFRTNPSTYWQSPNHPPAVPTQLIVGEDSLFLKRHFPQKIKAKLGIDYQVHRGGHMFPLEFPDSTVVLIKSLINQIQCSPQSL